jgi:hypothetical protein
MIVVGLVFGMLLLSVFEEGKDARERRRAGVRAGQAAIIASFWRMRPLL